MSLSPPLKRIPDADLRGLEALYSPRDRPPPAFRSVVGLGDRYLLITRPTGMRGIVCCTCWRLSWSRRDIEERYCGYCHQFHEDNAHA